MTPLEKLTALHDHHAQKNTCKLKQTATQAVYGNGNPNATIVFIGEAPGKNEDIKGVPFVGASGTFLDEMLASINMKREDIYITNIVKYRPPNNRDPLPEEKTACAEWLHDELTFIKPILIVFLGRHAMNHFFPTEKISEIHGELITKEIISIPTTYFLPLYHPAAAIYNRALREALLTDFTKIPNILRSIEQ